MEGRYNWKVEYVQEELAEQQEKLDSQASACSSIFIVVSWASRTTDCDLTAVVITDMHTRALDKHTCSHTHKPKNIPKGCKQVGKKG